MQVIYGTTETTNGTHQDTSFSVRIVAVNKHKIIVK